MSHKALQLTLLGSHPTLCILCGIISGETWTDFYTQQRGNWDRPTYRHHQSKWWTNELHWGYLQKCGWRVNTGAEITQSCITKVTPLWRVAHKGRFIAHFTTCRQLNRLDSVFFRQLTSEPLPGTSVGFCFFHDAQLFPSSKSFS